MSADVALMSAIKNDDLEAIQRAFPDLAGVNNCVFGVSASSGNPVLGDRPPFVCVAAYFGAASILGELISNGVDFSKRDDKRRGVAYFAVVGGRLSIVKMLAEHVDFGECGNLAAGLENLGILKFLVSECGIDVAGVDALGYTLLHSAAISGSAEIAQYLLDLSVIDVNARDHEGNTPLHLAAQNGNVPVARVLLDHPDIDLNPTNLKAKSVLHLAAQKKNESLISSILASAGIGGEAKPSVCF